MRILVSNDDGVEAPGLGSLAGALAPLGEVWVVAPGSEQSAASHAISLHRPLRIRPLGERRYAVDGTPTDCIYLAVNHLMAQARPDLVVSGINRGPNLADDVTYSGTVAAAMEGALFKIPSVAFSLVSGSAGWHYEPAAAFARALVQSAVDRPLPAGTLLNVNLPEGPIHGYALTALGKRSYGQLVAERRDPRGRPYYWLGGDPQGHENVPGSDCNAIYDQNLVSITPLHLDLTDHHVLEGMRGLRLEGYEGR